MRVVVVGSNPSRSSRSTAAFDVDTKSRSTLDAWLNCSDIECEIVYLNVHDLPTQGNKPLNLKQIRDAIPALHARISAAEPAKLVALGGSAAKALTLLRLNFYTMPHPSGRNRQLNDKQFIDEKIKGLKIYLESLSHLDTNC